MIFLVVLSALAGLTAGGLAIASHFFHRNIAAWTDLSAWNSLPVVVGAVYIAVSTAVAATVTVLWRWLMGILKGNGQPKKKVRAQSNRKTWS